MDSYEQACAAAPLGGARALQHRRRRLRQAPARQARRWSGRTSDGNQREVELGRAAGPRQPGRQRARARTASSAATASRSCCRRRPRPRRSSSAPGSSARSCSRCRCSTATRGSATASRTRRPKVLVTDAANADRIDRATWSSEVLVLDDDLLAGADDRLRDRRHRRPTTRPSSTTRPAPPGSRRASSTPTATSSPTRSSSTATTSQDGELFHGMGEWAWAAGIAPLLGPWRLGAVQFVYQREGGFDPHKQLDFLSPPRGDERLHDADGDAGDDGDRGRRRALPAEVPASSARPASRSTRRRSAGSASSTASRCSTTTG